MNIDKKTAYIKFAFYITIILIIIISVTKYAPNIIGIFKYPNEVRNYLLSIGILGNVIHVLILIIHVFVVVIPGDIIYVIGGFVFGLPMGFFLSYIGVLSGGFLVYNFSRLLGYDFVQKIVPKDKMENISNILNSTKGMIGLFIICIIPVFPKSTLMYISGLTPIKTSKLFFVYALSRIPVIFMWTAVGSNAYKENYLQMFIVIIILTVLALLGILIQKKYFKNN